MKTILFVLFLPLSCLIDLSAQQIESEWVYRIVASNSSDKKASTQTGFKIHGKEGIFTALHGIVKKMGTDGKVSINAYRFKYGTSLPIDSLLNLSISQIDIGRDLVLLKAEIPVNEGFLNSFKVKKILKPFEVLTVYGYPETKFLKPSQVIVQNPTVLLLDDLLKLDNDYNKYMIRKSPKLNQSVIQLGANQILPGNSGGPIVDASNQVLGIADGMRANRSGSSISTWAIPWSNTALKEYEINDTKLLKELMVLKNLCSSDEINEEGNTHNFIDYNPFNFKKKYPTYIFGISWSRPIEMQTNGITVSTNLQDLNAALDITFDKRIYKFFYLGVYVSSRYLQYQMLGEFNYDLPLVTDSYNLSTKKILDTYGVQASIIVFRGVLWHLYTGAGGFYNSDNSLENNYRGFVGYRKYMFHRQHFSLDIKALYSSQNQEFRIPTLGNAQPIIQPFKQYYLCAGINYSFQSKN